MIASTKSNVQVVVIDVDRLGIQPIKDLRLVFPNVRILALTADSILRGRPGRPERHARAVAGRTRELGSHDRATCPPAEGLRRRRAEEARHAPKAKPLPKAAGVLQKSLNTVLAKRTIQFEAGKTVLTPSGRATLDRLLMTLKQHPKAQIRIEGYTDSDGGAAANLALSRSRADAVRLYLISHGIRAASLTAVGFGESRPIASNATAAGKAKNRRIELRVTAG